MTLSSTNHLTKDEIIKKGSIYTPSSLVELCFSMVNKFINKEDVVIDFGSGYGAFINIFRKSKAKRIIATENDSKAVKILKENFTDIEIRQENSLINVVRSKYKINDENIIAIGNPPYNDVTSQYKKGEKGGITMDAELYSRDLGISFLKMYSALDVKYICVLHPLSYIMKKGNFKSLNKFTEKYKLIDATIFSSREFDGIKKSSIEFPVIAALYKKDTIGMTYNDVLNFNFKIYKSINTFKINHYQTIDGYIPKYPTKNKNDTDLQFYTIRDLNALKRNRTFLIGHCNNGLKVTKDNLHLYAWLDFLKENFPHNDRYYLFANMSPLFDKRVIHDEVFKNKIIAYACQNNKVVKEYLAIHDPKFLKKYQSYNFNIRDLIDSITILQQNNKEK